MWWIVRLTVASLLICSISVTTIVSAAELKPADISSRDGDGDDGKGNTADDTWQFWFELVHAPGTFRRFTRHSSEIPATGIPRKVTGPPAGLLPNPKDTEGWVLHTDWDARFEGVWADAKTDEMLIHPYVEKTSHMAVAITYIVPADGVYTVAGGVTDVQVKPDYPKHDGVIWKVEIATEGDKGQEVGKGGPIGDGKGRPDKDEFELKDVKLKKGQYVRFVVHPNKWWGQDLTRIDYLKIEPARE